MKLDVDQKIAEEVLAALKRLRSSSDIKTVTQEIGLIANRMRQLARGPTSAA
jgi:hypothetical protein